VLEEIRPNAAEFETILPSSGSPQERSDMRDPKKEAVEIEEAPVRARVWYKRQASLG
jgi:hypothetical protein